MSFRIDAKGKIFTDVVRKEEVPVLIQTTQGRIHGHIFLRPEQRIKDEMNGTEQFVAVTDAEVYDAAGKEIIYRSEFLTLNKGFIIWIRPDDEPEPETPEES